MGRRVTLTFRLGALVDPRIDVSRVGGGVVQRLRGVGP